jgi:iron(III) transport system permease protein
MGSLSFILGSYFQPFGENWQHIIDHLLFSVLLDTLALLGLNLLGCLVLGVSLAWFVCRYDFYGRAWLQWLLLLPLVIPPYITAFIMFDVFDSSGHINAQISILDFSLDLHHLGFASVAMIMVFYTYVYWLVRSSLMTMQGTLIEGAKNLGLGEWGLFFRVVLPLTKPAIIGGLGLVMLETLADFGTVSIFNIDTLTTLIYKTWHSLFDLHTALQISGILLLLVLFVYLCEKTFHNKGLRHNSRQGGGLPRKKLLGWQAWIVSGFCWTVAVCSFFIPLGSLVFMVLSQSEPIVWQGFFEVLINTLIIGSGTSVALVILSFILVTMHHQLSNDFSSSNNATVSNFITKLYALLRLGYVFPGSVIAISIVSVLVYLQQSLSSMGFGEILSGGSVLILIWAYMVRFFAVSLNTLEGSVCRINCNLPSIAMNLGSNQWKIKQRVYLPNLKIAVMSALVLVFIEVIKEMPATLLLRPYNWETLAVNIYGYTSEGEWAFAALPALAMIVLCLFFIGLVFRRM